MKYSKDYNFIGFEDFGYYDQTKKNLNCDIINIWINIHIDCVDKIYIKQLLLSCKIFKKKTQLHATSKIALIEKF